MAETDKTTSDADKKSDGGSQKHGASKWSSRRTPSVDVAKTRTFIARIVWAAFVVFALVLAVAALLIALEANPENDLVQFVIQFADNVDLGFFDLTNPIKDFDMSENNPAEDVKTALFNYGIGAIVWLVVGRIAERLIRP